MKKIISLLLTAAMVFTLSAVSMFSEGEDVSTPIGENDIFVALDGNDVNNGTLDAPLATINAAKEKAKTVAGEDAVNVWFREGRYYIDETVQFTAEDRKNVTYRAYNGENVEFFGGKYITGWETVEINGIIAWVADISDYYDFYTVFNKDGFLENTRYPEDKNEYLYAVADAKSFDGSDSYGVGTSAPITIYGNPSDLIEFYSIESLMCHLIARGWTDDIENVLGIDYQTGAMMLGYGNLFGLPTENRYWFNNVRETLKKPGQWYADKTEKKLYYVPQEGETLDNTEIYVGRLDTLFSLTETTGLSFIDLTFNCTDWVISPGPHAPNFSFSSEGLMFIDNANDTVIESCTFKNGGAIAVSIVGDSAGFVLKNSLITDIGVSGVAVADISSSNSHHSTDVTITDNEICRYGRVNFDGMGIGIEYCDGAVLEHNTIYDGYYNGIGLSALGIRELDDFGNHISNIKIRYNLIYDIGQGVISDMGGIYTSGWQKGGEIIGNVVHDVYRFEGEGGYGGHCLYFDQGSANHIIKNNLLYNCSDDGITITGCCSNLNVTNNIIGNSARCIGGGANLGDYWFTADDLNINHNNIQCLKHLHEYINYKVHHILG